MTSSPSTLKSFIDAAADRLAREIAAIRREAQREREVREAEHRARLAELEARISAAAELERRLADRLATLKDGEAGSNGADGQNGRDGVDGKDGASVKVDDVMPALTEIVEARLAEWDRPKDGQSVTVEDLTPLVTETVGKAVAALPAAKDGKDGRDGKDGERGPEGAPGKLPVARTWADGVHYEGAVVTWKGSTYQALKDTGREPPHEDWACLAAAGRAGVDGRSFNVRGTWLETEEYRALDIVALGGASFAARRDNPGACPGEGWQLIASQGKRGNPGERGLKGDKGDRGDDACSVIAAAVNAEGLLTLTMADGEQVTCDFYPVLSKLA